MSVAFHHPTSLDEATALAMRFGASARFLAGGTDLVVQLHRGALALDHLIALRGIPGLCGIAVRDDGIEIGALTTHKAIERHAIGLGGYAALAEAARVVGGHQVRNVATLGGNIVNASPAADAIPVLLTMDARVTLTGGAGTRALPLGRFLLGAGRTGRQGDEILSSVALARLPPGSATAFLKAGRRRAMEISLVCVAARLAIDPQTGRCNAVRIALGAVGPTGLRALDAEAAVEGAEPGEAVFREAGRLAAIACAPISDVRASARYRNLLVERLVPRALALCVMRSREARP